MLKSSFKSDSNVPLDVIVTSSYRRLVVAALCSLAAVLVAGCSQQEPGSPSPTTVPQTSGSGEPTAPKVSSPKNLKAHTACELLTAGQLQEIGATATPKPGKSVWGEANCQWQNGDINIYISPDTTQGKGLATVYQNMGGADTFKELQISGYPAVRTGQESINCSIGVGTSDTQDFLIDLTVLGTKRTNHEDPCALAQKVGADVLSNLPAGQ